MLYDLLKLIKAFEDPPTPENIALRLVGCNTMHGLTVSTLYTAEILASRIS